MLKLTYMKRKCISILPLVFILLSISACEPSLRGDEDIVKGIVFNFCKQRLENQLLTEITHKKGIYTELTYEQLVKDSTHSWGKPIIALVDTALKQLRLTVDDIRVVEKDKETGKIKCDAVLYINGQKGADLKYSAIKTIDNKKVYVELFSFEWKN
jgi:hypothetical protein